MVLITSSTSSLIFPAQTMPSHHPNIPRPHLVLDTPAINASKVLAMSCRCCSNGSSVAFRHSLAKFQAPKMARFGYGSIPIDTFLVGWTSIYQLFWCSLGARVLTHPHFMRFREISATKRWEESQPEKCRQRTKWTNGGDLSHKNWEFSCSLSMFIWQQCCSMDWFNGNCSVWDCKLRGSLIPDFL